MIVISWCIISVRPSISSLSYTIIAIIVSSIVIASVVISIGVITITIVKIIAGLGCPVVQTLAAAGVGHRGVDRG